MTTCVIALGANLGDRLAALQGAVDELASTPGLAITAVSGVFETDPVGGPEQPAYLNAVLVGECELDPLDLLRRAQQIEQHWQRTREVRWGPRTLDIDIIDIAGVQRHDAALTLPHPRAHERGFVVVPWLDADPDAVLTGFGRLDAVEVDTAGVRRTDDRLARR